MKRFGYLAALAAIIPAGILFGRKLWRRQGANDVVARHRDAVGARDWETVTALYIPDVRYSDPDVDLAGRDAVVQRARDLEQPFSDVSFEARAGCSANGFAVCKWTYRATQTGELVLPDGTRVPPTGRRIALPGVSLYELENGLIVAERSYWDNAGLREQLAAEQLTVV